MSNITTADITGVFDLDTGRLIGIAPKGVNDVTYLAGQDTQTNGVPVTATTSSDGGNVISGPDGAPAVALTSAGEGYHVILCAGESHVAGRGTLDTSIDVGDARIFQFGCASADGRYQTLFQGLDPLHHPEGVATGKNGPSTWFARHYLATHPSCPGVVIVPMGYGSTKLVDGSTPYWSPVLGAGYALAISQTNAAIVAAKAMLPGSRFVGVMWQQGANDVNLSVSKAAYKDQLAKVIKGFRAGITGGSGSWLVALGFPQIAVATNAAAYGVITDAISEVCQEQPRCLYLTGLAGNCTDNVHYTAPGSRASGAQAGIATLAAAAAVATRTPDAIGMAETIMRMRTTVLTTESGDGIAGWSYTAPGGATYAANRAGPTTAMIPSDVDGWMSATMGVAPTNTEAVVWGVKDSMADHAWNAASRGILFGITSDTVADQYRVIRNQATANPDVVVTRQVGDILRIRRAGTVVYAEIARAATPTAWTIIKTWTGVASQVNWWGHASYFGAMAISKITGSGAI